MTANNFFTLAAPRPLGLAWVWCCIRCHTPLVVIRGRVWFNCKRNRKDTK